MIALPVHAKFTTSIYDANGGTLATVYAAGPGDDVKAKRDEIITALNLHDELVAALKPFVDGGTYDNAMKWSEAIKAARAVIAKLKGA